MTPRQEAKAAGLKHYFTGKPCKHGHLRERFVSSMCCYQCLQTSERKAKMAARYQANREEIAAQYQANREELVARKARYAKDNPEKIKASSDKYRQANAKKIAVRQAAYAKSLPPSKRVEYATQRAEYNKANPHPIAALSAKRRAAKLQATPSWADIAAIKAIYEQCAEKTKTSGIKHAVDHVYPLTSTEVCGLHVAANLQILTKSENSRKKNFMPTPEQVPSDLE